MASWDRTARDILQLVGDHGLEMLNDPPKVTQQSYCGTGGCELNIGFFLHVKAKGGNAL